MDSVENKGLRYEKNLLFKVGLFFIKVSSICSILNKSYVWRGFILRLFRRTFGEMFFGAWHEFHNQTDSITHGGSISIPSYPLIHTFTVWWVMTNTICLTHSHGQTTLTELCICLARKNGETGNKTSVYQQIIVIIWMFKIIYDMAWMNAKVIFSKF